MQKAEKKGRTKAEVDEIIAWLTDYRGASLQRVIESKADLEAFYTRAPRMNPNAGLIQGVVCGIRVEDIADPLAENRLQPSQGSDRALPRARLSRV